MQVANSIVQKAAQVGLKYATKITSSMAVPRAIKMLPEKLNRGGILQPFEALTGKWLSYGAQRIIGYTWELTSKGQFLAGVAEGGTAGTTPGAEYPQGLTPIHRLGIFIGYMLGQLAGGGSQ